MFFFACYSKFFNFMFTFADFVYTVESISIKWTLYKAVSQMKILLLKLGIKCTRELKNCFHNEDLFVCMLLLCTTFRCFLCTVHYFLCAFLAKMATYSLVMDNVYFVISS